MPPQVTACCRSDSSILVAAGRIMGDCHVPCATASFDCTTSEFRLNAKGGNRRGAGAYVAIL